MNLYSGIGGLMNPYGGIGGLAQGLGQYSPAHDTRPIRLRLTERMDNNSAQIGRLTQENEIIAKTLAELDDHPYVERIGDAVRKLLG